MQEIADEAGVNKALLHYYFRSKERLAVAVFRRAAGRLMPRVFAILSSDAPLEEKVRTFVELEIDFLRRHPYLPAYVVSEANYQPDLVRQVFGVAGLPPLERLRGQIEERVRAGDFRPIGVEDFLVNLLSLVVYPFLARPLIGVLLGLEGERFEAFIDGRRSSVPDFFLGGLRP